MCFLFYDLRNGEQQFLPFDSNRTHRTIKFLPFCFVFFFQFGTFMFIALDKHKFPSNKIQIRPLFWDTKGHGDRLERKHYKKQSRKLLWQIASHYNCIQLATSLLTRKSFHLIEDILVS